MPTKLSRNGTEIATANDVANSYIPNAGNSDDSINLSLTRNNITLDTDGKAYYIHNNATPTANDEIATIGYVQNYINSLNANSTAY